MTVIEILAMDQSMTDLQILILQQKISIQRCKSYVIRLIPYPRTQFPDNSDKKPEPPPLGSHLEAG